MYPAAIKSKPNEDARCLHPYMYTDKTKLEPDEQDGKGIYYNE